MFRSKILTVYNAGKINSSAHVRPLLHFPCHFETSGKMKIPIRNLTDKVCGFDNKGVEKSLVNDEERISKEKNLSMTKNYHEENEIAVNEQILAELEACYAYLAIAMHYGRTDVALPGLFAFFFKMHLEELTHAHILMRYQLKRGGQLQLFTLEAPRCEEWTIQKSLEQGLQMEQNIKKQLTRVAETAAKNKDLALEDFIVSKFLHAQDDSIRDFGRLIQRYTDMKKGKCSCTVVDHLFDKQMHAVFIQKTAEEDELGLTDYEKVLM